MSISSNVGLRRDIVEGGAPFHIRSREEVAIGVKTKGEELTKLEWVTDDGGVGLHFGGGVKGRQGVYWPPVGICRCHHH